MDNEQQVKIRNTFIELSKRDDIDFVHSSICIRKDKKLFTFTYSDFITAKESEVVINLLAADICDIQKEKIKYYRR